jgi:hypothetical protein
MDILNFISWIKGKRIVTSVDPAKTLLPVALKDSRRDDDYLTGAITVEDFAASIVTPPAYKVYTALLTQVGIDAPVANILENTLGELTFNYLDIGVYSIESIDDIFLTDKTYTVLQLWGDDGISPKMAYIAHSSESQIILYLTDMNGNPSNILGGGPILTSIEIRVYN